MLGESKSISCPTQHGIYYLIGENEDNKIAQIYIGQTTNGFERLDDHKRNKDFWNIAIMFLADKKIFNRDIIVGLEKYAISKARNSRYKVENYVDPKNDIDEDELHFIKSTYNEI